MKWTECSCVYNGGECESLDLVHRIRIYHVGLNTKNWSIAVKRKGHLVGEYLVCPDHIDAVIKGSQRKYWVVRFLTPVPEQFKHYKCVQQETV
jgi:hypothetical protein